MFQTTNMASSYKLRCSVYGHEKDVRSLCNAYFPEGAFVSASRDVTARLWSPDEANLGYSESHTMSGHRNFVVTVCMMPPDEKYPHGLVMTGSNDNNIHAYSLESPEPQYTLKGHADTVCALAAGKFGSLLSGSWDNTAKVWLNQKCVMTLTGHEASVWAVALLPQGGYMLTGSADKTIRMWRAGKCERTFKGHTDCVRGLAVITSEEFLSCSNDTTVRRWRVSGECTQTYTGHTAFVYSISILPNGEDFVTGGEDRTMRVWQGGKCVQTLEHPAESVWAVCALSNGDVATGGSDGVIRVFSAAPERQADESTQKAYDEVVVAAAIGMQGDKLESLPGPEVLQQPGTVNNQIVRVRDGNNKVSAHKWNAAEEQWVKQDTLGGPPTAKKTEYEGKMYDYVFTVEIQEGAPALKLPYNQGDDPWMAAHTFLEKNDISPLFLDQVAKFIVSQTGGEAAITAPSSGFADPFTGGGRYIPGGAGGGAGSGAAGADPFTGGGRYVPPTQGRTNSAPAFGADPFTGSGSYKPSGVANNKQPATTNTYFPQTSYLFFEQANPQAILGKLREFNAKVGADRSVDEASLEALTGLMDNSTPTAQQLDTLCKILLWPNDLLFPALDVFRLCVRGAAANQHFFNEKDGPDTVALLLAVLSAGQCAPNHMLVMRALCNALKHPEGEKMILAHRDNIITTSLENMVVGNKNVDVSFNTLLLDFAVASCQNPDVEAKAQVLSAAATALPNQRDGEAQFRLLVTLGTLVTQDENGIALARSLDIPEAVQKFLDISTPPKLPECARMLLSSLQ